MEATVAEVDHFTGIRPVIPTVRGAIFEEMASDVYADALKVLLKKHKDYGPLNITLSPGGPINGLRVRMYDKLARINNLFESGAAPENESFKDSFVDLLNYSAIGILVLQGQWPDLDPRR